MTLQLNQVTYELAFIDRFSGSVVLTGDVSSVESALQQVVYSLHEILDFSIPKSLGAESLEENDGNGFSWLW